MEASQVPQSQNPESWLVRTAKNRILGPFSRQELSEKIKGGAFELQDEICPANGYWIYLHEREEVLRNLGIEVPRSNVDHDEVTETQTDLRNRYKNATSSTSAAQPVTEPRPSANGGPEPGEKTAEIVILPMVDGVPVRKPIEVEKTSIFRGIVWVMLLAVGIVLTLVFKLIRVKG